MQPTWTRHHKFPTMFSRWASVYQTRERRERDSGATSDDELLAVDPRVPLGALQQGDPVVHLLWRVGVAVQHAVGRDDDKGVGPEKQSANERAPPTAGSDTTSVGVAKLRPQGHMKPNKCTIQGQLSLKITSVN